MLLLWLERKEGAQEQRENSSKSHFAHDIRTLLFCEQNWNNNNTDDDAIF